MKIIKRTLRAVDIIVPKGYSLVTICRDRKSNHLDGCFWQDKVTVFFSGSEKPDVKVTSDLYEKW